MKILISLFFALLFITFGVQYFSNGSASAAMEEGTALVAIKTPESYSQNAQIGQRLFEAKCADCHGPNAVGQAGVAPPLIHIIYDPIIMVMRASSARSHWAYAHTTGNSETCQQWQALPERK